MKCPPKNTEAAKNKSRMNTTTSKWKTDKKRDIYIVSISP